MDATGVMPVACQPREIICHEQTMHDWRGLPVQVGEAVDSVLQEGQFQVCVQG
jgi:hypothetical protein